MKLIVVIVSIALVVIGLFLFLPGVLNKESSGFFRDIISISSNQENNEKTGDYIAANGDGTVSGSGASGGGSAGGGSAGAGGGSSESSGTNCQEIQISYSLGNFNKNENCLDGDSCLEREIRCSATLTNLNYDVDGNFGVSLYLINEGDSIENYIDSFSLEKVISPRENFVFSNNFLFSGNQSVECQYKTHLVPKVEVCG